MSLKSLAENNTFTYKTLITEECEVLEACTSLLSTASHTLFKDLLAKKDISKLKKDYIRKFGITARQFNSCRVGVEGLIRSQNELMKQRIQDLQCNIEKLKKVIEKLSAKKSNGLIVFKKRRRLNRLNQRLFKIKEDLKNGDIHLCFGGKKLFNAQFHLHESGYRSHDEWKHDWKNKRNKSFFLVGSKDETAGNQSCTASIQPNGKFSLRVRIPDALFEQFGKYLTIPDVYFPYGHENIEKAILNCSKQTKLEKINGTLNAPISYRFIHEERGWYVSVTISLPEPKWLTDHKNGVVGVDINTDHIAITEMDRFGNPLASTSIPLVLYGKSTNQAKAIIGDACAQIIEIAKCVKKDLVIENLDFNRKRKELDQLNQALSRKLSSFAYNKIIQTIKSRAWRSGVKVHQVNPCYTSVIGRVKFATKYGLTTHQAAALSIGRRYYGFSERSPCGQVLIPDNKGCHVAFDVPVRNRRKHVWSHWGVISRELQAVHVARKRAIKNRSKASVNSQAL
jgi:IS605 OrfB family transposase